MKYVSIDIETTGLDPEKHDIIEFAAVIDDLKNPIPLAIPYSSLPTFHCYFRKDAYSGSAYALSLHSKIFKLIYESDPFHNYNRRDYFVFDYIDGKIETNFSHSFYEFLKEHNLQRENFISEKINVAGKNLSNFDLRFLRHNCIHDITNSFHYRTIDPGLMYIEENDEHVPSTEECKKRAGLDGDVSHTAVEDAIDVIKLIRFKMSKGNPK